MNNDKQLTPEEMPSTTKDANEWALEMMDIHFPEIDPVDTMWRRVADIYVHSYNAHVKVAKEYAAQQTAAKDEEIKKHQGSLKEMGLLVLQLQQDNKEKGERIKELEGQVKMRHAAYLEGVAEIKALEDDKEQKGARIAELEKDTKTMYDKMHGKIRFEKVKNTQLLEKIKQLKKERDDLKYKLQKSQDAFTMTETSRNFNKAEVDRWKSAFNERNREWLADKKERDQAYAKLERIDSRINSIIEAAKSSYYCGDETLESIEEVESLLSSHENKKP